MEGLDRISLYRNFQGILDRREGELANFFEEKFNYFSERSITELSNLLRFNIIMLDGIERHYLIESGRVGIRTEDFELRYNENLRRIKEEEIIDEKYFWKLEHFMRRTEKGNDGYYVFSDLIRLLNSINNSFIKSNFINNLELPLINIYDIQEIKGYRLNQVFLSHAFDDKLYTLALFIFMLKKNILLYVDWLFCPEFKDGIQIKCNLSRKLYESSQLLFLRTINSELNIRGGSIRGWCSWELGTFYSMCNKSNKFYIEVYRGKRNGSKNKQLDGISVLRDIVNGKLI